MATSYCSNSINYSICLIKCLAKLTLAKMTWNLYLDDMIHDPDAPSRHVPEGFVGAENCEQAIALVKEHGMPAFMDLDHDLSDGKDTMFFLKWLAYEYWTGEEIPEYNVHSANPIGKQNIESFMNSWNKSK